MTTTNQYDHFSLANGQAVSLQVFETLHPLEETWRSLESSDDGNDFAFQTFDWIDTWHTHLGQKFTLCPVLLTTDELEPLAILPLGIHSRGPIKCLTWLGGELADYHAPMMNKAALTLFASADSLSIQKLWQLICSALPAHDCVLLEKQPASIGELPNPFIFNRSTPHSCNAHATKILGSLDDFIASKQSASWRKKERRSERRLQDSGVIRFVLADSDDCINEMLDVLFQQKSRSYKELGAADLFADPQQRAFVRAYTHSKARAKGALLCGLYVGDILTATAWCIVHAKRCYFLLPTYENNELMRYSPGNLLLRHLFAWCLQNDIDTFDFTAGDEAYKIAWCDLTLELRDDLSGVTIRGHLYVAIEKIRRHIKLRVKQSPALFNLAKRVRARS